MQFSWWRLSLHSDAAHIAKMSKKSLSIMLMNAVPALWCCTHITNDTKKSLAIELMKAVSTLWCCCTHRKDDKKKVEQLSWWRLSLHSDAAHISQMTQKSWAIKLMKALSALWCCTCCKDYKKFINTTDEGCLCTLKLHTYQRWQKKFSNFSWRMLSLHSYGAHIAKMTKQV
jgi:hypothetical protein